MISARQICITFTLTTHWSLGQTGVYGDLYV